MEPGTPQAQQSSDSANGVFKRKRSPSAEPQPAPAPPAKVAKTHSSHLQINYLARQYSDTLALVSVEDSLPTILQLLVDYSGVLERHESLAGNLGARPLGPILIKRFERLFDGPPRVLKSHGKEGTLVSWLDVVEFARHKPEQFNLEKMRDGVRVCQFYTKQSRVEISEEDYFLISSGMPQKLIPPQPIPEDEEKELGTLEIMEKSIAQIIQLADQVSARARQFKHRLLSRKNAIINRRESEAASVVEATVETPNAETERSLGSPTSASGFVAVNRSAKEGTTSNGAQPTTNGKSAAATASASTRAELLSHFTVIRERQGDLATDATPPNISRSYSAKLKSKQAANNEVDFASVLLNSASPVPIPNTPSNLVNYPRPTQAERLDDSGPYKAEMLSRMETLQRGDRVLPPCDRCRRLHMDCLKNLTACQGCTRKHAKCSWKDVTEQELIDNPRLPAKEENAITNGEGASVMAVAPPAEGPPQPVRDEELLGEDDSDDDARPPATVANQGLELEPVGHETKEAVAGLSPELPRQLPTEDDHPSDHLLAEDMAVLDRMGHEAREAQAAKEYIESAAREVLRQSIVEVPAANASRGFEPVNAPSSASMPEVRVHEPTREPQEAPEPDQYPQKHEPYLLEEPDKEITYEVNRWTSHDPDTQTGMEYRPYG